jgi:hypothetical protein
MRVFLRFLTAFVLLAEGLRAATAPGDLNAVIALVRSRLGTEAVLNELKTIHYRGKYEKSDGAPTGRLAGNFESFFQKPFQQRLALSFTSGREEITALDGLESWMRIKEGADQRLTLFPKEQTKALRIVTWQTLDFFRGIERVGGTAEFLGEENADGVACWKVAFRHETNLTYTYFFDKATGRMVVAKISRRQAPYTVVEGEMREEGELIVDGIRFPRKTISTFKEPSGQTTTIIQENEKITVGETFPAALFAVPSIGSLRQ